MDFNAKAQRCKDAGRIGRDAGEVFLTAKNAKERRNRMRRIFDLDGHKRTQRTQKMGFKTVALTAKISNHAKEGRT